MSKPYEEGNPDAKICFLAEAPARTEMRMGKPLVGPSGQLFDRSIHTAGIPRRDTYILNVWETEVKRGAKGTITDSYGDTLWTEKSGFTEAGLEAAQPTIQRLQKCKANVICPLGGVPLDLMYQDHRITKWRGSILESSRLPGRKIVPTVHPAFLLRGQYIMRYPFISDLARVREESSHAEIRLRKRIYRLDPSYDEAIAYLDLANTQQAIATDIEVLNHQVSCFSVAISPDDVICISLVGRQGHRWTIEQEVEIWRRYALILANPDVMKINQNLIFDLGFLIKQMGIFYDGPLGDTMVAHHIIWPDFPKGLDYLCSIHTREPYYKDDGKLWSKPWADLDQFWLYNAKDSATAFEIWENLQDHLNNGFRSSYEETIDLFPALLYMMTRGILVDLDQLEEYKKNTAKKIGEKEAELAETADYPFNPGSSKQCIEYFYTHKGIKPYTNAKTHRPTCDDKALARIVRRFNLPEARLVQELRGLNKLMSTYLTAGIDPDSRLRCSYNPRGTTTGRLSSSQTIFGGGLNMQNLHPEFKEFLVADYVE